MQPGQIIIIGPIPAHLRTLETRAVRALPPPSRGELRSMLALALTGAASVVALAILSIITP